MKSTLVIATVCFGLMASQARAGCVTGAVVGGVAGHVAGHHALAGAAVGCIAGHELSVRKKKQIAAQRAAAHAQEVNAAGRNH